MVVDEQLISRGNQINNEADSSKSDAPSSDIEADYSEEDESEDEEDGEEDDNDSEEDDNDSEEELSLREEMQRTKNGILPESTGDVRKDKLAAKRFRESQKDKEKSKLVSEIPNPAKQSLAKLLQAAWENLISSFGLTIIWIDIHIFLSHVLGKDLFCELGEEWFPKGTPRNIDGAKRSVGMTEKMGVACINIGCLLLLIAILAIISMIVSAISNPIQTGLKIFGDLLCAAVGGCSK